MSKITTAILPVGGLGTRFLPATKAIPKEMLPVLNKPLIQYAFEEAIEAGIEKFIFITGRNKNAITNHFDNAFEIEQSLNEKEKHDLLNEMQKWMPNPGSIAFVRQQHPKGLGHAVWCAKNFIQDEAFVVMLADELFLSAKGGKRSTLKNMIKMYEESQKYSIASDYIETEKTHKYGIFSLQDDGKIIDMVEKPASNPPSNYAAVGRYVLPRNIFDLLEIQNPGAGGEIQLTDAIQADLTQNDYYKCKVSDIRVDCGSEFGLLEANIRLGLQDPAMKKHIEKILAND